MCSTPSPSQSLKKKKHFDYAAWIAEGGLFFNVIWSVHIALLLVRSTRFSFQMYFIVRLELNGEGDISKHDLLPAILKCKTSFTAAHCHLCKGE